MLRHFLVSKSLTPLCKGVEEEGKAFVSSGREGFTALSTDPRLPMSTISKMEPVEGGCLVRGPL